MPAARTPDHPADLSPEGVTSGAVPVYNVALPLLQNTFPDQPPFKVVDVPAGPPAGSQSGDARARQVLA